MNTGTCLLGYIYKFKPSNVVDEVGKLRYSPEVTLHSLETFSLLLARVPLKLAIYQVESISF